MQTASGRGEAPAVILHARHEHGGHPVTVVRPNDAIAMFDVGWPTGTTRYPSARQLLRALYNGGDTSPTARDPGVTFDRYFRVNKHAPKDDIVGPTIFDLFGVDDLPPDPPLSIEGILHEAPRVSRKRQPKRVNGGITTLSLFGTRPSDKRLTVQTTPAKHRRPLTVDVAAVGPIGIDLERRAHEVRKLMFAGFGSRIFRAGYDPEDVLQEVYKGLLARNRGRCRFNPAKSSFGHYVHMVISCVLANYHRKSIRRSAHEQVGMYVHGESEEGFPSDAALGATDVPEGLPPWSGEVGTIEGELGEGKALEHLQLELMHSGKPERELASEALPLLYMGYKRAEIARELDVEAAKVGRALALIRQVAKPWGKELGYAVP